MERNKETFNKTLPVYPSQQRQLKEELEMLVYLKEKTK